MRGGGLVSCDLCGSRNFKVLFAGSDMRHSAPGEYRMVECEDCGLLYLNPRPTEDELSPHYPTDYAPHQSGKGIVASITKALRKQEARRIAGRLPGSARVLEVGCAAGDLLIHLKNAGLDAAGVEMSPFAADAARQQGLTVHTGVLATAPLKEGDYDAIVMRAVIPHLPSPRADLRLAASALKPGGLLFITVDNVACWERRVFGMDWYGYDVPRHLNLFTPTTMEKLLNDCGFRMVRASFNIAPNHWIGSINFLLKRKGASLSMRRLVSIKNPLLVALFLPLTTVQRLVGASSRLSVIAQRRVC